MIYERFNVAFRGKNFYLVVVMHMKLCWKAQGVFYLPLPERLGYLTETSSLCHHLRCIIRVDVGLVAIVDHLLLPT